MAPPQSELDSQTCVAPAAQEASHEVPSWVPPSTRPRQHTSPDEQLLDPVQARASLPAPVHIAAGEHAVVVPRAPVVTQHTSVAGLHVGAALPSRPGAPQTICAVAPPLLEDAAPPDDPDEELPVPEELAVPDEPVPDEPDCPDELDAPEEAPAPEEEPGDPEDPSSPEDDPFAPEEAPDEPPSPPEVCPPSELPHPTPIANPAAINPKPRIRNVRIESPPSPAPRGTDITRRQAETIVSLTRAGEAEATRQRPERDRDRYGCFSITASP
jgi:hypothetical protein